MLVRKAWHGIPGCCYLYFKGLIGFFQVKSYGWMPQCSAMSEKQTTYFCFLFIPLTTNSVQSSVNHQLLVR